MKRLLILMGTCFFSSYLFSIQEINKTDNSYDALLRAGLLNKAQTLRLHLGCGESHLDGYINIDFPPAEHTVQTRSGADIFGDITLLRFSNNTVDEIRSHHVFEHFNRQVALSLLCSWHLFLKQGGILCIETPDFEKSIQMIQGNQLDYGQKQIVLRHIFGSHEAYWAMHYDGWYQEKFEHVLGYLGFEVTNVKKTHYKVIDNIIIYARKKENYSANELKRRARDILKESMVDNSSSENTMLNTWYKEFESKFNGTII